MDVYRLAHDLKADLARGCERIEIAGSIRRQRPDPHDIEIVCIPKVLDAPIYDLFQVEVASAGENILFTILPPMDWGYDYVNKKNGPKYKRLRHVETGVCCDLFIVRPETWGVQLAIRTGPAAFSKELVSRPKLKQMQVKDAQLWRVHRDHSLTPIPTPEEDDFFKAIGLPFIKPQDRDEFAVSHGLRI